MPVYKHRMNHKQRAGKVKAYEGKRQRNKVATPCTAFYEKKRDTDPQGPKISSGKTET